jgi:hypothetical protein
MISFWGYQWLWISPTLCQCPQFTLRRGLISISCSFLLGFLLRDTSTTRNFGPMHQWRHLRKFSLSPNYFRDFRFVTPFSLNFHEFLIISFERDVICFLPFFTHTTTRFFKMWLRIQNLWRFMRHWTVTAASNHNPIDDLQVSRFWLTFLFLELSWISRNFQTFFRNTLDRGLQLYRDSIYCLSCTAANAFMLESSFVVIAILFFQAIMYFLANLIQHWRFPNDFEVWL